MKLYLAMLNVVLTLTGCKTSANDLSEAVHASEYLNRIRKISSNLSCSEIQTTALSDQEIVNLRTRIKNELELEYFHFFPPFNRDARIGLCNLFRILERLHDEGVRLKYVRLGRLEGTIVRWEEVDYSFGASPPAYVVKFKTVLASMDSDELKSIRNETVKKILRFRRLINLTNETHLETENGKQIRLVGASFFKETTHRGAETELEVDTLMALRKSLANIVKVVASWGDDAKKGEIYLHDISPEHPYFIKLYAVDADDAPELESYGPVSKYVN